MDMTLLCLTGWQQPADALASIAPEAVHFDYSAYPGPEAVFAALPREPQAAIGWSLGGQLLVRAIAGGHIRPKALVLLGTPYQWVTDKHFGHGVAQEVADEARAKYAGEPETMLPGFNTLIALGDRHEKDIVTALDANRGLWPNGAFWLEELSRASCHELDFSAFPHTVIVHGAKDKVIAPENATAFTERLPTAELLLWAECAHAPHLHEPETLRAVLKPYV